MAKCGNIEKRTLKFSFWWVICDFVMYVSGFSLQMQHEIHMWLLFPFAPNNQRILVLCWCWQATLSSPVAWATCIMSKCVGLLILCLYLYQYIFIQRRVFLIQPVSSHVKTSNALRKCGEVFIYSSIWNSYITLEYDQHKGSFYTLLINAPTSSTSRKRSFITGS